MDLLLFEYFLCQSGCDKIEDGILTEQERLREFRKSCLQNEGNIRIYESSKSRLE